jgi:N6-L-threonylcarbamoyladenine synthase/protein kinase Bud32
MVVLGIEGTAWAASAAVYDPATDTVTIESDPYQPARGGIHPREAAEHMRSAVPAVIERVLEQTDDDIEAVAFSRGPGLGPCLRTVGSAARALAGTLAVPLVGVNHMVAHAEIGRHRSGFSNPLCLNASGANAHVLVYRHGRYRVLGETMDTGVGNAIDKFTRHLGWSHPGGPKVEAAAEDGEYVDLPYVVKGMDFSFAGLSSAAQDAADDGVPVADICYSLQAHVFAMLTEVTERALSLTGNDELVLGGGVGQNARLQSMLTTMCERRGADFYTPEHRFLRDNAGMIAVLGAKQYAAGDTVSIPDSDVRPDFRPDEVSVTWRDDAGTAMSPVADGPVRGAEATVSVDGDRVVKRRQPRAYRVPALDERLRRQRTAAEARLTSLARRAGVPTPVVYDVDRQQGRLVLEHVGDADLAAALSSEHVAAVGRHLATLHDASLVHGDPTTRNARVAPDEGRVYCIDFGLGYHTTDPEDHAMDLHVFGGSLDGTTEDADQYRERLRDAYADAADDAEQVLTQLAAIEGRGRYQ